MYTPKKNCIMETLNKTIPKVQRSDFFNSSFVMLLIPITIQARGIKNCITGIFPFKLSATSFQNNTAVRDSAPLIIVNIPPEIVNFVFILYNPHLFFYIILDKLSSVKIFCLVICKNIYMDRIFCNNLKSVRIESGFTQKQVAEKLGVVESCYANWEQGRTEPNVSTLRKLGEIFEISVDELLNDKF